MKVITLKEMVKLNNTQDMFALITNIVYIEE